MTFLSAIQSELLPSSPSALSSYHSYILCTHKTSSSLWRHLCLLFAASCSLQCQSWGLTMWWGEKQKERRKSVGSRKRNWEQMVQLNTTCCCRPKARLPEPLFPGSVGQNIEGRVFLRKWRCSDVRCGLHWVCGHSLCVFSAWFTMAAAHYAVSSWTAPGTEPPDAFC